MEIPKVYLYSTFTALFISAFIYLGLRCKKKRFRKVGRVSRIIFYPVKSLTGFEAEKAICAESGLKNEAIQDRMWMLARTEDNRNVTIIEEPRLVLVHTRIEDNQLIIDCEGLETLKVDIIKELPVGAKIEEYQVLELENRIKALDCGDEAAKWFQTFLKRSDVRLIQYLPEFEKRPSVFRKLVDLKEEDFPVVFQSGSQFLVLSQPSVDELNDKLEEEEKVTYKNFRANILLDDCDAFEEDKWKYLKIGEAVLIRTTPCDRCAITKVNTDSGIRSKEEPIRALKTYRLTNDPKWKKVFKLKPLFGMNYGLLCRGEIRVGDEVYGSD